MRSVNHALLLKICKVVPESRIVDFLSGYEEPENAAFSAATRAAQKTAFSVARRAAGAVPTRRWSQSLKGPSSACDFNLLTLSHKEASEARFWSTIFLVAGFS